MSETAIRQGAGGELAELVFTARSGRDVRAILAELDDEDARELLEGVASLEIAIRCLESPARPAASTMRKGPRRVAG